MLYFDGNTRNFSHSYEINGQPILGELQFLMSYFTQSDRENLAVLDKISSAVWHFYDIR